MTGRRFANEDVFRERLRDSFETLELLIGLTIQSRSQSSPTGSENQGEVYIVASGGSGAWAGEDGNLAIKDAGSWTFFRPGAAALEQALEGYIVDENTFVVWDPENSEWVDAGGAGGSAVSHGAEDILVQETSDGVFEILFQEDGTVLVQG